MLTNQEVSIGAGNDPRYSELCVLFNEYWNGARVFDKKELEAYQQATWRYERGNLGPLVSSMMRFKVAG